MNKGEIEIDKEISRILTKHNGIRWRLTAFLNVLRAKLINKLLGDNLTLEVNDAPSGLELQLIDMKRRISYGRWRAGRIVLKKIELIPLPLFESKNSIRH